MPYYFEDHQSLFAFTGGHVDRALETIARRYVGHNPPHPATFRAYAKRGILRGKDYRYEAAFNRYFPNAKLEQFVYAWSKYWADAPGELKFDVSCASPLVIYCNGQQVFKSDIFSERYPDERHTLFIPVQAGWNHLVIRFKKTRAGFGGVFGTWLGKLPYYFLMPTPERDGQEGWIFTTPLSEELGTLPGPGATEESTGLTWLPETAWDPAHQNMGQLQRIFGLHSDHYAIGWTRAMFLRPGKGDYVLKGRHQGAFSLFIDDEELLSVPGSGALSATLKIPFGQHDVMVRCVCEGSDWGFELALQAGGEKVRFISPCNITGTSQPWIFAGPMRASIPFAPKDFRNLDRLVPAAQGDSYWRLDLPDAWVRQYNDNPLYGRWNYPLGVTLYGLLHSAKAISSAEIQHYIVSHIQFCADKFKYALWDRANYGGATNVHHLLTSLDSLDDCGSFGSVLLEVAKYFDIRGAREIADYVANFITNEQDRQPDGTFYRRELMHIFHENTMWADDLYMSVPFLCRYYQLTNDRKYVDDAARQFIGFKKRLYLPELKIMAHVYDFRRNMNTGVPWGRGNGWTIFSLSELLAVLPQDHAERPALLQFFRDLCEGYLTLQDEQGMWHQVLTHPDSYPETSCTSMFTYAFARGVQYGWLDKPAPYIKAVYKAWEALNRISVDRGGNVHGVCRGSEFSFTPEYYKKELLWNLNDTHGIGIVLLAGVEVRKLSAHLQQCSCKEKAK